MWAKSEDVQRVGISWNRELRATSEGLKDQSVPHVDNSKAHEVAAQI